jgi:molecular chaperone GrpE
MTVNQTEPERDFPEDPAEPDMMEQAEAAEAPTERKAAEHEAAEASTESAAGQQPAEPQPVGRAAEEIAALKDRLLRALAENENLIRRAKRDREDTAKYAAANFARDMLTVADNLNRALAAVPESVRGDEMTRAFVEGVELTGRELLAALERHGIRKISPLGEKFNHDLHEALFEVPTSDAAPGTVVQVLEDGYVIHDRLLRAAKVGIARALPGGDGGHRVDTTA